MKIVKYNIFYREKEEAEDWRWWEQTEGEYLFAASF